MLRCLHSRVPGSGGLFRRVGEHGKIAVGFQDGIAHGAEVRITLDAQLLQQLVHGDLPLFHVHAPAAAELQDGVAGDAGQDRAVEHGGDDLAVDLEHDVHGGERTGGFGSTSN